MSDANKVQIAMELSSEVLVGILRRRAKAKSMDLGTLLVEASQNTQEADRVLDELAAKGHEPEPAE